MGKAADNEKIKLQAAFANNIGVALIATGILVPILSVYHSLPALLPALSAAIHGKPSFGFVAAVAGSASYFIAGLLVHRFALKKVAKIVE